MITREGVGSRITATVCDTIVLKTDKPQAGNDTAANYKQQVTPTQ